MELINNGLIVCMRAMKMTNIDVYGASAEAIVQVIKDNNV